MNPVRTIAAVLAAVVLALTVAAGPAQAWLSCYEKDHCWYDGYNGVTRIAHFDAADRPGCFNIQDNVVSSVDNKQVGVTSRNIRVYRSSSVCSGESTLVYAQTEGNMAGIWHNSIDSIYVY